MENSYGGHVPPYRLSAPGIMPKRQKSLTPSETWTLMKSHRKRAVPKLTVISHFIDSIHKYLLTECEGRAGKYLARRQGVRIERSEVRTSRPRAKYFPVRPDFFSVNEQFLIWPLAGDYIIKFDVTWSYVKRQTAKMKLLSSVFSSLNSRVTIFVFVANSRRHFSIFMWFNEGLEEKNTNSDVIFAVCRST